ncbi:type III secretion system needle length determinant, SpaN/EivJ family [Candidatus Williamhamiltonella defendens]|uniref:Type III surface presentation of antigens protein n=1 Tax=Hamiltonella defensa subsp. Acyrthosiphon pisum (strain 5AT) TaxID=572265 RepID=C4K6D4_HAMD5|nr:type III secretion system needle length determinant, SpaN/EivJ family [Candidatus Hamiltonella defensa]ACQ68127.1 putative type III surface presentation of antigens protein [Candidatus Hamiltonella defensa 5AT (Acyrthosiphon pisum)]ATW22737.1 hypothetical protein BJP44_06680 [Candidatus Hamiltonella defensa]
MQEKIDIGFLQNNLQQEMPENEIKALPVPKQDKDLQLDSFLSEKLKTLLKKGLEGQCSDQQKEVNHTSQKSSEINDEFDDMSTEEYDTSEKEDDTLPKEANMVIQVYKPMSSHELEQIRKPQAESKASDDIQAGSLESNCLRKKHLMAASYAEKQTQMNPIKGEKVAPISPETKNQKGLEKSDTLNTEPVLHPYHHHKDKVKDDVLPEDKTSDFLSFKVGEKKEIREKMESTPTGMHLHQTFKEQQPLVGKNTPELASKKQELPFVQDITNLKEADTGNNYHFKSWKGAGEKSVNIVMPPKINDEPRQFLLTPSSPAVGQHLKDHWEEANHGRWVLLDDQNEQPKDHQHQAKQEEQMDEEST